MQQNFGREWHGHYRARVVEVDIDQNDYGAVRVFVPDLFAKDIITKSSKNFDEYKNGLIAYPANNSMGGYSTDDPDKSASYQGSMHVPLKNAWVWIRFEGGDPARPFYTGAFMFRNSKVLPECRGLDEPHKSYVLCKTHSGQALVVCDSPDQRRIELTGKKRQISGDLEGDSASVYGIDGNMTSILLDERDGKEKILIKSHKGDYIHFDIDERQFQAYFKSNIMFESEGNMDIKIKGNLTLKVDGDIVTESGGNQSTKNGGSNVLESNGVISSKSSYLTSIDSGGMVSIQFPMAFSATDANPVAPQGLRST